MDRQFTLEYWHDDDWLVGRLKEVPGVFSQGETLEELEANIQDAYELIVSEISAAGHPAAKTKAITLKVA